MSKKKQTEVRLNQKTGKITVKGANSPYNMGIVMYKGDYVYIVVDKKDSAIKKAKKMLMCAEKKKLDSIIKDAERKRKNLLKNKI